MSIKHLWLYLYDCLPESLQPLFTAPLHVDHILVVSLQRPLQAVHRLEHQVLAFIQLLLENLQSVNLNADTEKNGQAVNSNISVAPFERDPCLCLQSDAILNTLSGRYR